MPARPEMIADAAFGFSAEPFGEIDDLRAFGDEGNAAAAHQLADITAHFFQKFACDRTVLRGDREMAVITSKAIEHRAADDLAVPFHAHGGPWRINDVIYFCADIFGDPRIGDDQATMSASSKVMSKQPIRKKKKPPGGGCVLFCM